MGAQPTPEESLSSETVPRPDPTVMTSRQLAIATDSLKELLRAEVRGLVEVFEARFSALNNAGDLLQVISNNQPQMMNEKVDALRVLHNERFTSIQTQFIERDTRTEQTSRDSKVAVDAALQAAKEAVGKQQEASDRAIAKSETSTLKQLEAIQTLISSNTKASDEKVTDVKDRLTRIESASLGSRNTTSMQIAVTGVVVAIVVAASALITRREPVPVIPVQQVSENTSRLDALTRALEQLRPIPVAPK